MSSRSPLSFVAIDLETTDLSAEKAGIIEVGLARFEDGVLKDTWSSLLDPGHSIPPIVTSITGITDADVQGKPTFSQVRDEIISFIGDAPIVGHNVTFDLDHLAAHGAVLSRDVVFDTWPLSALLIQEVRSYSLEALARGLQLHHVEAHRALDDARVSGDLFVHLVHRMRQLPNDLLTEIDRTLFRRTYSFAPLFADALKHPETAEKTLSVSPPPRRPRRKKSVTPGDGSSTEGDHRFATQSLPVELQQIVAPDGLLSQRIDSYEYRPVQLAYAEAIHDAIHKKQSLIIESPQGVGRRLGYLLPLGIEATRSSDRTRSAIAFPSDTRLQSFLAVEWPHMEATLGLTHDHLAILEEPEEYLCPVKFELFKRRHALNENEVHVLIKTIIWLHRSPSGRLRELVLQPQERPLLRLLRCRSHAQGEHDCGKSGCPFHAAQEAARKASILLMQHRDVHRFVHTAKELPHPDVLVIDEARALISSAGRMERYSFTGLSYRLQDLAPTFPRQGYIDLLDGEVTEIREAIVSCQNQLTMLQGLLGILISKHGLREDDDTRVTADAILRGSLEWMQAQRAFESFEERWNAALALLGARSVDTGIELVMRDVDESIHRGVELFMRADVRLDLLVTGDQIWMESPSQESLSLDQLEIPSIIVTDRVLRVNHSYAYVRDRLHMPGATEEIVLPDHLPFESSVIIGVPSQMPSVVSPAFTAMATEIIRGIASYASNGRKMLILTSSVSLLPPLMQALEGEHPNLLVQGIGGGKAKMLEMMRHDPYDLVIGTYRSWKDIDFPHRFSAIIVLKLPFDPPTGAEVDFMGQTVPDMTLSLRDLFRHLLRKSTDKGAILLIDPRLESKGYGHVILQSLPRAPLIIDRGDRVVDKIAEHLSSPVDN